MHSHPKHRSSEEIAAGLGLPPSAAQPALVAYRSVGIGAFGAATRWGGMPLEKVALYVNSSQVSSGRGPFRQAVRLAFREGWTAPYRVVGPASLAAWFMQYSVMGVAFQFFDQTLSTVLGVRPMYYGRELMEPATRGRERPPEERTASYRTKFAAKTLLSPVLAACLESYVSNRAEAQRYFGPARFAALEGSAGRAALRRAAGPAFGANVTRNVIMCQTSFLLTPLTYKLCFPQEHKSKSTLFWYGLTLNVFVGNVAAISAQALWGRSLDYLQETGRIEYRQVIRRGLSTEGIAAFFTVPKWFSRVLMNAPAQGTLPWFYNEVLPLGEHAFLRAFSSLVYGPFLLTTPPSPPPPQEQGVPLKVFGRPSRLQRHRSHYATLPTANPEFDDYTESEAEAYHHDRGAAATEESTTRSRYRQEFAGRVVDNVVAGPAATSPAQTAEDR
jgi:hypothetical protein